VLQNSVSENICMVKGIEYRLDINTLEQQTGCTALQMNDIAKIRLLASNPLVYDSYLKNKTMGSLILIDPDSNETVGAGMVTFYGRSVHRP
ncbi:MAG: hypothetical protein J6X35_05610, partial [Bacteroidales bacterium]|nr:hypothetical protein [Bacteroidales bacterium]